MYVALIVMHIWEDIINDSQILHKATTLYFRHFKFSWSCPKFLFLADMGQMSKHEYVICQKVCIVRELACFRHQTLSLSSRSLDTKYYSNIQTVAHNFYTKDVGCSFMSHLKLKRTFKDCSLN